MLSFKNPGFFILLILIPLLFFLRSLRVFKRISFPAVLSDFQGESFEWNKNGRKILSLTAKFFYAAAFAALVTALAGPVISNQEKIFSEPGTDVIFILDTSPSMAAKDMDGFSRLEASKNAVRSIMENQEGYGFGLVLVGSEAAVAIPPTINHQFFEQKLADVAVGIMGDGTALGDGISTSVYHLASSSAQKKCMILLTDGENNAGKIHPETAAQLASEHEIALHIVGVGSKGTVPFEYTDPKTGKNYVGTLESDYNSASLRKLAATGNGKYFEVRTIDELRFSLQNIASRENSNQAFSYQNSQRELYKKVLGFAIILFFLAIFLRLVVLKGILALRLDFKYKKRVILRWIFLAAALVCAILAYSGLSWGNYLASVQKNSSCVAMVFDISHSMMADDCPDGMTRLEAASIYAKQLISRMDDAAVSVVIAKGDGMEIIPMTQDKSAVTSLLDVLSPALMTEPGSSIGKGILQARRSIPANFSYAGKIWVFTDGEESDGALAGALEECMRGGIPVTIIGFGKETESAVLAGDGVTTVRTALRSEKVREAIRTADEKYRILAGHQPIQYVNFLEKGSAVRLLDQLKKSGTENLVTSYEVRPVPRHQIFMIFAAVFVALSFILPEFAQVALTTVFLAVLGGCSAETGFVMRGTYAYHQGKFRTAIAEFKKAAESAEQSENQQALDYALYNLGSTYAAMDEREAAEKYFLAVSNEAPDSLRFAAFYNIGILAHKNGDFEAARDNFRKALEIDSHSIDAKINMELSLQVANQGAREAQSEAIQGSEEKDGQSDLEKSIFEHIKENDQKQWKNSEQTSPQNFADDF